MIETVIGGVIALSSGIIVGILTPSVNARIQTKRLINQRILQLTSTLYLLKNTLYSYLNQYIYIDMLGEVEAAIDECQRLKTINDKLNGIWDTLYGVQEELIIHFKNDYDSVALVYKKLNELEGYVWNQKMHFNDNKNIYDQESSDDYSITLNKMIEQSLIPQIHSLILLNQTVLKTKSMKRNRLK